MVRIQRLLAPVLVCGCLLLPLGSVAAPAASEAQETSTSALGGVTSDSWVGALASMACGLSIKMTILTAGTVVATIAAAVSSCSLMIMDGLFDRD